MRRNILLTLLLVLITTVGVRAEVVPIQKQSVGTHAVTTNQQETILQLQEENKKLKEQLERTEMDKEIQRCRDYVDRRANDINDNLSHWLVILTIIVTLISGGLGVVAPYFRNKEMQAKLNVATRRAIEATQQAGIAKGQTEEATNQVTKATEQIATATEQVKKATSQVAIATEQAETAKKQADDATKQAKKAEIALKEIEALKRQVDAIQTKINEDKTKAEDAAKAAKVSQLFAQAFYEKDLSRAIELYTQMLALKPDYAEAYNNRGNVKFDLGDKDGALSDYNKAIELKPDYAMAYYNRGIVKRKLDNLSGALSDYDKAISLKPDYADAYNNRGWLKIGLGDLAGALSDCNKAIDLKPDDAEVYDSRAVCYRKMAEEEKNEEKKKEYIALAKADEKKYNELTGGKKK